MPPFMNDLENASRRLVRRPGFTLLAIAILACGIGLNSAVFSLINAVLFRPLPVAAPQELVAIYSQESGDFLGHSPLSSSDYEELDDHVGGLSELFAYTYTPMALEYGEQTRLVLGVRATANYFSALGVAAFAGRLFTPVEDGAEPPAEVILSHAAWQRRFAADRAVVGSRMRLNGRPHTVVGVAPQGFFGLTHAAAPELWVPMTVRDAPSAVDVGDGAGPGSLRWLWVAGRMTAGKTATGNALERLSSELASVAARLARESPASRGERTFVALPAATVRILPGVDATLSAAATVVLTVVGLVLLVAGANVANLLVARAIDRRREIATRLALGASPAAIARQWLAESLLLAAGGGLAGLALAQAANLALGSLSLPLPIDLALAPALDVRVVSFTVAVSAIIALVAGLAPVLEATRTDLTVRLKSGTLLATRSSSRFRDGLVIAQVALSFILLVSAALAARSLALAGRVDPGFDPENVAVVSVAPGLQGRDAEEGATFLRRFAERARELPGVEAAGWTSHLPLTVEITFERLSAYPSSSPPDRWPSVDAALVGPGYFETLRVPLLRGRTFDDRDELGGRPVAVVNRTLAERLWPGEDPLGQRMLIGSGERVYEVVGMVADGKYRTLGEAPRPFLYRALEQNPARAGGDGEITTGLRTLVVRSHADPQALLDALRTVARELDPGIALARLEALEETLAVALFLPRTAALLFGLFGLVGLLLAGAGIHGLMAYAVERRRREIGLRMALGAVRRDVVVMVLKRALRLIAVGLLLGLGGAIAAARAQSALLHGAAAGDLASYAAAAVVFLGLGLLASWSPARRASGVDPQTALRDE